LRSYHFGTAAVLLVACAKDGGRVDPKSSAPVDGVASASASATVASAPPAPDLDATAEADAPPPGPTEEEAVATLYPQGGAPTDCMSPGRVQCLIGRLYAKDTAARDLALDLYRDSGDVAGVERSFTMNGGFRGDIQIVPELPIGKYRDRLSWVVSSAKDFDAFFRDVAAAADAGAPRYRWRGVTIKFFRSVNRTTPSAFASPWTFSFNVDGSLLKTETGARETLFHEFFHMNDAEHGDWTPKHFATDYDAILKKCGASITCLDPYAPNDTRVVGGTYYAFQPNNGVPVREYGAELALRWYKEHRAFLRHERPPFAKPFKCGPPENARSWSAIVAEFFGGIDLIPPCP
jgi:hypothetical protein